MQVLLTIGLSAVIYFEPMLLLIVLGVGWRDTERHQQPCSGLRQQNSGNRLRPSRDTLRVPGSVG